MIIKREVNGIKYEAVLRGEFEATGEVRQFAVVVHDPDLQGGRREGFLAAPDKVPENHVVVATLAIK